MSVSTKFDGATLVVSRQFSAAPAAVFDAWIETSKIELWWGCEDTVCVNSVVEATTGGKYHQRSTIKGGIENDVIGWITLIDPPRLLEFDVEGTERQVAYRVRVEFSDRDGGTFVCLTQTKIPTGFDQYVAQGWTDGFTKLADCLEIQT